MNLPCIELFLMDLSVAMCTYNGERYLEDQLESIMDQTRPPDELVVCDDNSGDETPQILKDYKEDFPDTIKLFFNHGTLGVTENFEQCIEKCKGDLIALSDQDDVWQPQKLEIQERRLLEHEASLTFHNAQVIDEFGNDIGDRWEMLSYHPKSEWSREQHYQALLKRFPASGHTLMFDEDLRKDIVPFPKNYIHDLYIVLIAASLSKIEPINEKLVKFRQHRNQISTGPPSGFLDLLARSVDSIGNYYGREVKTNFWKILQNDVEKIRKEERVPNEIIELIRERYEYERNRAIIHHPNKRFDTKLKSISDNIEQSYYSKFGIFSVYAYIIKDIIGAFGSHLPYFVP